MPYKKGKAKTGVKTSNIKKIARKEAEKVLHGESEPKRFFGTLTGTFYNAFTPFQITNIAQGNTDTSRIGDTAKPISIRLAITISRYIDTRVRVLVFHWKPDTAISTPTLSQVLENTTYYAESEYKRDTEKDYKILHDKSYLLDSASRPNVIGDWESKLRIGKMQFNAGATTGHGHIYIAIFSNDAYANGGSFILRHKVEFLDV